MKWSEIDHEATNMPVVIKRCAHNRLHRRTTKARSAVTIRETMGKASKVLRAPSFIIPQIGGFLIDS